MKCPIESCGYEGRSDNVKRHIKTRHQQTIVVSQVRLEAHSADEAPNDDYAGSKQLGINIACHSSKAQTHKEIRSKAFKGKKVSSLTEHGKKSTANNGFQARSRPSWEQGKKVYEAISKGVKSIRKVTQISLPKKKKEEALVKHHKSPNHNSVVLFDIDKEEDRVSLKSQV